jgi:membrane protease YdiL (CAAX protease family)
MHQTKLSRNLLIINSAILLVCAVFDYSYRDTALMLMLLFLPFLDRSWSFQLNKNYQYRFYLNALVVFFIIFISVLRPQAINLIPGILLLTALPEEWFFRVYLLKRLENFCNSQFMANLITSVFFSLLHLPTQGAMGLSVFIPSLFFGWLYQQKRDFILLVLVHALFNLFYMLIVKDKIHFTWNVF